MSKSVLVTGGAGYIGSQTCKALKAAGFEPVAYDNLELGDKSFVRWGPLVIGDTRNSLQVKAALLEHDIQAVIHFAALSSVGESVTAPDRYYDNNVGGLIGLLAGMRAAGCDTLVFSSTAAVYGEPERSPIQETAVTEPVNPYGRSKLMCEHILGDCRSAYGLKFAALRYFNASGADVGGEIGELREVETHLIPRALMSLQGHIHDFTVFGSDYPTPDGTAIRDYVHVSDLADAHVLALLHLIKGGEGGIFNLGTGEGHSVGEVLAEIARITGHSMIAPKGQRRAGDPTSLIADPSRARAVLGFNACRSTLAEIVQSAWDWHQRSHPAGGAITNPDGSVRKLRRGAVQEALSG